MHILTGNLIRDLPTNRVNGLSAQVWRSCSETGPIIHLGSKVGRGETYKTSCITSQLQQVTKGSESQPTFWLL